MNILPYEDLQTEYDEDGGRLYITPDGNKYPSVTTILGRQDSTHLEEWKKRIGEEEAERKTKSAARRGSMIHDLMEEYIIHGKEYTLKELNPFIFNMYKPVLAYIKENLQGTIVCEAALYSDKLKVAGRVDLIGIMGNMPWIIDFKTAFNMKEESWISSYKKQVAAYSMMFYERTGIKVKKYRILMVAEGGEFKVFEGNTQDHAKDFIDLLA